LEEKINASSSWQRVTHSSLGKRLYDITEQNALWIKRMQHNGILSSSNGVPDKYVL